MHAGQIAVHQSHGSQLAESADDPGQQRAAGHRRDDVIRIAPAKLLHDLEPVRLRAFGVVRPQVDVHEAPAVAIRHLRAEAVHVVVGAGDGENRRVEDRGTEQFAGFEIVRDEHAALDAKPRRVRGHAVREVAGGRARKHLETKLQRPRRRHRDDAILVRQRRMVHRVIFDVQLAQAEAIGQPIAAHERREPGMKAGSRLAGDRQELAIAPEILRPLLDRFARQTHGENVAPNIRGEQRDADQDRSRQGPGRKLVQRPPKRRSRAA